MAIVVFIEPADDQTQQLPQHILNLSALHLLYLPLALNPLALMGIAAILLLDLPVSPLLALVSDLTSF